MTSQLKFLVTLMFWLIEVSYNCSIAADNQYLLESIAACNNRNYKLVMYFTINMAFANYLDMFPNVTESFPLIRDKTIHEQPLPINLSIPDFDTSLLYVLLT